MCESCRVRPDHDVEGSAHVSMFRRIGISALELPKPLVIHRQSHRAGNALNDTVMARCIS
jgi:hypothetical protein